MNFQKMNVSTNPMNDPEINPKNNNKKANYFEFRNFFKKIKKFIIDKTNKIFKPKKKFVKEPEPGEKNKNVKTKKRPYWIHIIHVILFFVAYLFYFISLNRCFDGEDVFQNEYNKSITEYSDNEFFCDKKRKHYYPNHYEAYTFRLRTHQEDAHGSISFIMLVEPAENTRLGDSITIFYAMNKEKIAFSAESEKDAKKRLK